MTIDLSLKAKRLLATQHNKLMFDESAVANNSGILAEVLNWCGDLEFKPGKWIKSNQTYQFEREYIAHINQTLIDGKYASIFEDFSQDNHQSAAQRNPNEKQGKLKPTAHLVLSAVTEKSILNVVTQVLHSSQQINIELDVNRLKLDDFDCLVIIENCDSFNDWFEYKKYTNLSRPLVIYRGDKHHSIACKKLLKNWLVTQGNRYSIYFGDYDLAALRIAISGGYTHLLLPEYNDLAKQAIKQHYPDNHQKYLSGLERDCPKCLEPLLQLMIDKRAGLRQQRMYGIPLKIYPITY